MKINGQNPIAKTQGPSATAKVVTKTALRVIPANSDRVDATGGRTRLASTASKPEPMALEISTTFGESLVQLADAVKKIKT